MAHNVFISYAAPDRAVADAACTSLETRDIKCWIAPRDVTPGKPWAEVIVDAIDESHIFVLVLSTASNNSPQVIREVGRAASKGIPLVALRIADIRLSKSMEFFISSHQWLDAQTPPIQEHLENLALVVQRLLTNGSEKSYDKKQPPEEEGTDRPHKADSSDEDEILTRLRKEISAANSSRELQHMIQRLEDYLGEHPHAAHARVLKDEIKTATRRIEAVMGTQSSVWLSVRRVLLRWGWLVALIAIGITVIIVLVTSLR